MHHLTPVYGNVCSGSSTTFRPSFIDKSMILNSLTAVSPCVMRQCFAVIAAFSYAAAFDLMKNVNRQAGYVTQCRVSGGLVIGLKTEPHWECDLNQTYATFVLTDVTCYKIKPASICHLSHNVCVLHDCICLLMRWNSVFSYFP